MQSEYIIDFERLNSLTSSDKDTPSEGYGGVYMYGISRKIIKELLDVYLNPTSKNADRLHFAIETLQYNKILISRSDMRERKLNSIIG